MLDLSLNGQKGARGRRSDLVRYYSRLSKAEGTYRQTSTGFKSKLRGADLASGLVRLTATLGTGCRDASAQNGGASSALVRR